MLDLRQLRAFATVVREGSFTRAAAGLHYAQSSVTAQVQQLEAELGVPLLDRLPGRLEVTSAGEQFLPYAERLLELAAEAREAVHAGAEPAGTLTLSACESVLTYRLPLLLRTFQDRYPRVKVELHAAGICEAGPPMGPDVDVAVSISETLTAQNLLTKTLRSEPVCLVAASDHPIALRGGITAADIAAEQLLLTEDTCSYRGLFERRMAEERARATRTLAFSSVEAIKQCVYARMGVAVLPRMVVAADLERGTLACLPWPKPALTVYTQLVRRREKWFSPAMQAFWRCATEMLRVPRAERES